MKNPKLDSNSALAKKRRAKASGGAAPPTIQEQITQESMEVNTSIHGISDLKNYLQGT